MPLLGKTGVINNNCYIVTRCIEKIATNKSMLGGGQLRVGEAKYPSLVTQLTGASDLRVQSNSPGSP